MKKIIEDAWLLALGNANAILLRDGDNLVLFDAGFPGKEQVVFDAVGPSSAGSRSDLKHLVFTHGHPDHIGSAAAIVRETGATTWMHAADAPYAESGGPFRPMTRAPGLDARPHLPNGLEAGQADAAIRHRQTHGGWRRVARGRRSSGHRNTRSLRGAGGLSLARRATADRGDVFMNVFGVADPIGFEDEAEGRRSQRRLASLSFDAAAFGHGGAITANASSRVRRKLGL